MSILAEDSKASVEVKVSLDRTNKTLQCQSYTVQLKSEVNLQLVIKNMYHQHHSCFIQEKNKKNGLTCYTFHFSSLLGPL